MRRMGEERNVLLGHEWWIRRNMILIFAKIILNFNRLNNNRQSIIIRLRDISIPCIRNRISNNNAIEFSNIENYN